MAFLCTWGWKVAIQIEQEGQVGLGKNKRRNHRGPTDRIGCAFDLQTERLPEKASCSKSRIAD
jgi:hypothetical protein